MWFSRLLCFASLFGLATVLFAQKAGNFESIVRDADAARDSGKAEAAINLYQQALHLKPDWKQGWWVLGSVLYDANRYPECADVFLPLTVLDPGKPAGWTMAGLCEFETKRYKDALHHLEIGVKIGLPPELYSVAQYHRELILVRIGAFEAALDLLSRDAARGPKNPKLLEAMGAAALRMAVLPQDVPAAHQELVLSVGRAMWDGASGRNKDAAAEFRTILAKYPSVPELHYLNGMILLQSDADQALAAFQEELTRSPQHTAALISIATEYLKRNEYQTALTYADRAVKSAPDSFAAHATLGKVLVEGGIDLHRGIQELESAAKMSPGNPQCHLALASAYAKAGRKNDAAEQRSAFLKLRTDIDASGAVSR